MKKKLLVPVTLAILAIAMFGGVASAAEPAIKGCVGEIISAQAEAGRWWGYGVSSFARFDEPEGRDDPAGLGDEIQFLQSGGDTLIFNACRE